MNDTLKTLGKSKIANKDWDRMLDLVLTNKDGESVAKSIKNKDKAIARFVSGMKLKGLSVRYDDRWKEYNGSFSSFGNKALSLGATPDEIKSVFDSTTIPDKYNDKLNSLSDKKLNDRFVGVISKTVINAGLDINFLPHNGNAITMMGRDAMNRNGRKWTIGYKSEITVDDKKVKLFFDAITDEAINNAPPTLYVIDYRNSDSMFGSIHSYVPMGIRKFTSKIMIVLTKNN